VKAIPDPVPGRVRSRLTSYAGAGFADTLFRAGAFALPLVPGIEVAGRVRAAGPGVEGFAPGHRVGALLNDFGRSPRAGGYAELAVAHASMAARIPAGLDSAIAASAVVNAVTVWVALRELARVGPRDRVAVFTPAASRNRSTGRLASLPTLGGVRPGTTGRSVITLIPYMAAFDSLARLPLFVRAPNSA